MFYDLNIPWPAQFNLAIGSSSKSSNKKQKKDDRAGEGGSKQREQVALSPIQYEKMKALTVDLSDLGYGTCAYNHIVDGKFDPNKHRNPFHPSHSPQSQPPFPEFDPIASTSAVTLGQSDVKMRQLSRMTLILNDDSMGKVGHGMTAASTSALLGYDLLAAQAFNDASFSLLCLTLSELKPNGIDIISLDLSTSPRLPFFLKRSTVNAALANGVVFEICYSKVVNRQGESRETASRDRKNVIATARDILRVTNGKGVIFSSGATDALGLRGPNDVVNLATIFGLNQAAARDCISSACRSLILRAETRKTFRGVVAQPVVVPLAGAPTESTEQTSKRKADRELSDGVAKRARAQMV